MYDDINVAQSRKVYLSPAIFYLDTQVSIINITTRLVVSFFLLGAKPLLKAGRPIYPSLRTTHSKFLRAYFYLASLLLLIVIVLPLYYVYFPFRVLYTPLETDPLALRGRFLGLFNQSLNVPRPVLVFPLVRDDIPNLLIPREPKRPHQIKHGLLFILGLNHQVHIGRTGRQRRDARAMFPPVARREGARTGFRVVHLLPDPLARPGTADACAEGRLGDVPGALATLGGVEDDVVVVVVQDQRDVELLAHGEQVVDGPRDVVVLEDQPAPDGVGQRLIGLAEPVDGRWFPAGFGKGTAHV